jgi:membrane glycosyltransferase
VVDPVANAIHCALLGGTRGGRPSLRAARHGLVARALAEGPAALGPFERRVLLADVEPMIDLHRGVWQLPDSRRAGAWGVSAG